jgi:hypothetical protein
LLPFPSGLGKRDIHANSSVDRACHAHRRLCGTLRGILVPSAPGLRTGCASQPLGTLCSRPAAELPARMAPEPIGALRSRPVLANGAPAIGTCAARIELIDQDDRPPNPRADNRSDRIIRCGAISRIAAMGATQPSSPCAAARAAGDPAVQRSGSAIDDPPARKSGTAALALAWHGVAGLLRAADLFRSGRITEDHRAPQPSPSPDTSACFARPRERRPIRRTAACPNALNDPIGPVAA